MKTLSKITVQLSMAIFVILTSTNCARNTVAMSEKNPVVVTVPGQPPVVAFEEKTTTVRSTTLFDGKNTIDKQRVSLGAKSQSVGQSGIATESSATNVAPVLGSLGELIGKAAKAAVIQ